MRNLLIIVLLAVGTGRAQETRTEVTSKPTTDDIRPNSPGVAETYTQQGRFQHIVIVRMKYGAELLAGLDSAVSRDKIRNGVILSGIGSAKSYSYHVVSNREFPTRNIFISDTAAPVDIAGINGYIVDGRVHAHVLFSNADRAFGGHLEKGTVVFTFAIVTIGVLDDSLDIRRVDDKTYR